MGLYLEVGVLADLKRSDEEGFTDLRAELMRLNQALVAAGLREHQEPEDIPDESVFGCQMYGYVGLHCLRRIAAYESFGRSMPPPGDREASKDRVMNRYYSQVTGGGFFERIFRRRRPQLNFGHLMIHSDAEGYYIPQDFEEVVFPDPALKIAGGMVGSTQRLLAECERLATLLELPHDLKYDSEELWLAPDRQGEGETNWQRYGIESFTCIRLIRACEASLRLGAAICFC